LAVFFFATYGAWGERCVRAPVGLYLLPCFVGVKRESLVTLILPATAHFFTVFVWSDSVFCGERWVAPKLVSNKRRA
jgi:hypothetical protein